MVGIVVVSHSRRLARSVAELADTMLGERSAALAYAGGVGGADAEFGTDATDILDAIESVASEDGVVVLMDMGSALLSAEMAVELADTDVPIRLIAAPLVEGTMTAAVQAVAGADIAAVISEARGALEAKRAQLGDSIDAAASTMRESIRPNASPDELRKTFVIRNTHGLHVRPATKLIQLVGTFDAAVTVSNLSKARGPVTARSLNRLSGLEITRGDEILVSATGSDAATAIQAIEALVVDNFGERSGSSATPVGATRARKPPDGTVAMSPGIGLGTALRIDATTIVVPRHTVTDPASEGERFRAAVAKVRDQLATRLRALEDAGVAERAIFEAHETLLNDPDLFDATLQLVRSESLSAASAFSERAAAIEATYTNLNDVYLQVRAGDVRDIAQQVLHALGVAPRSGRHTDKPLDHETVVVAVELTPSQTASLDVERVVGIVTERGGPTSHTAILARSLGIPAVGGYGAIAEVADGALVAVDGLEGSVVLNPDRVVADQIRRRRRKWIDHRDRLRAAAAAPGATKDGVAFPVEANISGPTEMDAALEHGAEGIGLLRTEFLYLGRASAPTVAEQRAYFSRIFERSGGKPITVRTFDIGGDKRIPYLDLEDEENPFLGVRGIRIYKHNSKIFTDHIEAILVAALGHDVRVMFPMVTKVAEFRDAAATVERVHRDLAGRREPHKWPLEIGVMIETPASVLLADELARQARFFSIGTNDLTQYVLAAARDSAGLGAFLDTFEPSVLRAVRTVAQIGSRRSVPVSVCGEFGADISAIPLLVGLGVCKISAGPTSIPTIKAAVSQVDAARTRKAVHRIVAAADNAAEVKERLAALLRE